MNIEELQPNLIVQDGRETLKVSTIYGDDHVTASVVLPVPKRTTVRHYDAFAVGGWRPVSDQKYKEYEVAYSS
jgi:hypothetical protein